MATAARKRGGRGGAGSRGVFAPAVRETIEYAERIHERPRACPMFPEVIGHSAITETICYMQGYLAGRIASTGKRPSRQEMRELRSAVLHDPKVSDIIVGTQRTVRLGVGDTYPSEF
ncbi:MAG: hypothetical protein OXU86_05105 [Thaumarchaeota archaeon]|nr:hypothetical protein [Nitrososphaerota archaeon]MDD9842448.1 hypothetical protein [Nitrososphaerota archaeon]RNJ73086.1 MAG: hypothetical protein EB832_02560 [Thaumarchaeota archaeon S14]